MSEQNNEPGILPDPLFKLLTRVQAEAVGLKLLESELQYSTRADLVIEVPLEVDTVGTLFDFFRPVTVLEFKSENDEFNLHEFTLNEIRTAILFVRSNDRDYSRFLNVCVLSRLPETFLEISSQNGVLFEPDGERPWLWRGKAGFQQVVLVICRDLPIEKRYYRWLLFAPAKGRKWQAFIRKLVDEDETALLEMAEKLRPKEFSMIKVNVEEMFETLRKEGSLTPQMEARLAQERVEAVQILLDNIQEKYPWQLAAFFDDMNDEQRAKVVEALDEWRLKMYISRLSGEQFLKIEKLVTKKLGLDLDSE